MHKPIRFTDLGLSFPHKLCFADFNEQVYFGTRIAIIGRNGIGKSTLLKMIQGACILISYEEDFLQALERSLDAAQRNQGDQKTTLLKKIMNNGYLNNLNYPAFHQGEDYQEN